MRSPTAAASAARARKLTATSAPASAKASAIARPMPRLAPVTSATRPLSVMGSGNDSGDESESAGLPRRDEHPLPAAYGRAAAVHFDLQLARLAVAIDLLGLHAEQVVARRFTQHAI